MSIDELLKNDNYHSKEPKDLPEIIWHLDESELIHHFIDYWGNGPKTTVQKLTI